MNEEERKTQIEINLILKRVVSDLERMEELRETVRDIPALDRKLEEVYHSIFVGEGEGNLSIMQRLVLLEKRKPKAGLGPKERAAFYTALSVILAALAKAYSNAHQ